MKQTEDPSLLAIRYIIIWGLIGSALLVVAFGPRGNEGVPRNVVVVDYWEKWSGYEEQQMRQIIDDFNNGVGHDKGIYVRYLSMSNVNSKTLVATAGGAPPDIAGMFDWNMVQFASLDAIEPLEDMAREKGIGPGTYKRVYWNSLNYEGHLYALISTPAAIGLLYNKKIFQEDADALRAAGLDPDRPPKTLAELDRYAAVINIKDAYGHVRRAGTLPLEPGWYLYYLPYWFGSSTWDEKRHKFTLTDPQTVKAFDWIQSYSRVLGKAAAAEFQGSLGNFDSPQNAFMHGDLAMEMNGPWMANYIFHNNPAMSTLLWPREVEMTKPLAERRKNYAWAVAPFPSAVAGLNDVAYCTSDILAIPKGAKHKKEAFEFMAYLTTQSVMEKLCKLHCKNSPLDKVSDDFVNHHPNPYIDVYERLARSPNAHSAPQVPIFQQMRDELDLTIQKLALMELDTPTAMQQAQDQLQARYDEFVAQQDLRRSRAIGGAHSERNGITR